MLCQFYFYCIDSGDVTHFLSSWCRVEEHATEHAVASRLDKQPNSDQYDFSVTLTCDVLTCPQHGEDDVVVLDVNAEGVVFPKSQVTDYRCRRHSLADYNLLDFIVNTYEDDVTGGDTEDVEASNDSMPQTLGRPRNTQIHYLCNHPNYQRQHRIIRSAGHNNLPDVVGHWFPCRDDKERQEYYMASMLTLLKPWQCLVTDLKEQSQSWADV